MEGDKETPSLGSSCHRQYHASERRVINDALSSIYASLLGRPSSIVYSAAAIGIHPSRARQMMQENMLCYQKPIGEWSEMKPGDLRAELDGKKGI